LENTKNVQISV